MSIVYYYKGKLSINENKNAFATESVLKGGEAAPWPNPAGFGPKESPCGALLCKSLRDLMEPPITADCPLSLYEN